jgi:hypothetical protein
MARVSNNDFEKTRSSERSGPFQTIQMRFLKKRGIYKATVAGVFTPLLQCV